MLKVKTKIRRLSIGILSITAGFCAGNTVLNVSAEDEIPEVDPLGEEAVVSAQANNDNTQLDVNVKESLTVSVTTPSSWATGDAGDFLRNKISLSVTSNNTAGYTASMYADETDAKLFNTDDSSYYIPTLSSAQTRGNFPSNYWGYSLGATNSTITTAETDEGNDSAVYAAMTNSTSSPITIRESGGPGTFSDNIYFGTKANTSQVAGIYSGTVVISVVSGVVDNNTNPITPTDPATNTDDSNTTDSYATYDSTNERSVYSYTTTNTGGTGYTTRTSFATGDTTDTTARTDTTTTEVIEGNYTNPLGVTETSGSNVSSNTALAVGLAVTAGVAATSSLIFFALARRKNDDDEEEE